VWTPSALVAYQKRPLRLVRGMCGMGTRTLLMCPLCGGWLRYLDGIGWWECAGCDEWWALSELREVAERRNPGGKSTDGQAHPRVVPSGCYPVA